MTSKAGKLAAAVLLAVVAAMAQPAAACEFGAGVPVVIQEATCQIIRASGEPQTGTYRWEVTREAAAIIGMVQVAEDGAFASEAFRAAARDIPHEVALGVVESLEEVMELLWAMQGDRFEGPPTDALFPGLRVIYGSANTNRLLPALGRSSGVRRMKPDAVPAEPVLTATYCRPSTA